VTAAASRMIALLSMVLTLLAAAGDVGRLGDDAGLGATAAGRLLLEYTVQCALPESDSVVTRRDGRDVLLHGSLGLAPQWKHEAMTAVDERWITACILARMNAFGVTVKLSLRGDHDALRNVEASERHQYTYEEGAFYGNFFADPPVLYACSGTGSARRAPARRLRVCTEAAPTGEATNRCGMVMTGACTVVCEQHDGVYEGCFGAGERYDEVLTVFLETPHD